MAPTRRFFSPPSHVIKPKDFVQLLFLVVVLTVLALNVFVPNYSPNLRQWLPPDYTPAANYISEENGRLTWKHKPAGVGISLSDVTDLRNKSQVLLVVVVSTAPVRQERRDAIRETWWKHCRTGRVSWSL